MLGTHVDMTRRLWQDSRAPPLAADADKAAVRVVESSLLLGASGGPCRPHRLRGVGVSLPAPSGTVRASPPRLPAALAALAVSSRRLSDAAQTVRRRPGRHRGTWRAQRRLGDPVAQGRVCPNHTGGRERCGGRVVPSTRTEGRGQRAGVGELGLSGVFWNPAPQGPKAAPRPRWEEG